MDDLQFERAEFGASPPARNCTGCHQPIVGHYFDVNGQPFCEACTVSIRQAHGDSPGGAAPNSARSNCRSSMRSGVGRGQRIERHFRHWNTSL